MLLSLTAIDKHQEERHFSCLLPELDVAFDVLNHIVAEGDILIRADLIDENRPMPLPVETFDGVSFSSVLHQLQLVWNTVLAEPRRPGIDPNIRHTRLCWQQLICYEQRIIQLELMITDLSRLYQRAEDVLQPASKPSGNPYQAALTRCKSQLSRAYLFRKELLERL